jgi:NAD(P)-dependent dehydrogenase (short-subunit alcohol dehydrogenase family)
VISFEVNIRVASWRSTPPRVHPSCFSPTCRPKRRFRKLAIELHGTFDSVDVLINNVGAIYARREPTTDGVEKTLALNHLAPFLLTTLLLDLVRAAAADNVERFLKLQCAWP